MNLASIFSEQFVAEPVSLNTINGKPALRLPCEGRLLSEFAAELGGLLEGQGIFNRKGMAFTVDSEGQRLKLAEGGWLRTWVESHVVPYKNTRGGAGGPFAISKTMTKETADAVLLSPQFLERIPRLERFLPCPMPWLRDGGEIELLPIGLDKPSGSLCADPGFEITSMPLPEAVAELESLLEEFPWPGDNGRSKAVAIAAMLTTFAGGIMPPRSAKPVFIYVANAEGSGKTTLAQLAGLPYTESPAEAAPRTEEEWQKKLLALVISGRRLVILDNLKGHLNSPAFEAYTSTATFGGRILGGSREFTGEAGATILITGNGLTFTADLRRRSLVVELFMPQLRAEDRTYKRRLSPSAILRLRPRVLSALWGIISAWDQAGRPRPSKVNGSFPEWCETICAIVEFAKWGSPVAEAQIDGMGDTDTADFEKLASAMEPGTNYTFQSLAVLIEEAGLFDRIVSDKESGELSQRAKAKLATILKQFSNRRVSETKVFRVISSGHQRRYAILPPAR